MSAVDGCLGEGSVRKRELQEQKLGRRYKIVQKLSLSGGKGARG